LSHHHLDHSARSAIEGIAIVYDVGQNPGAVERVAGIGVDATEEATNGLGLERMFG
jgi:hypothetical protein